MSLQQSYPRRYYQITKWSNLAWMLSMPNCQYTNLGTKKIYKFGKLQMCHIKYNQMIILPFNIGHMVK